MSKGLSTDVNECLPSYKSPCYQSLSFACLILVHSRKTRLNRGRSLLSMRDMLLGYSFEPRPNSRALSIADSVMTIGFSIDRCSHSKKQFDARNKNVYSRSSGCGDHKGLTRFRQSLFLFPSIKKRMKALLSSL